LQSQTEKLLQFAYTESRHLHLNKDAVNVHNIIKEAVSNLAPLISEKSAELHYELRATDPVVQADRDYILVVITNLVDNAVKYSKQPFITIATENGNRTLKVSITDNGIGIEKKELKKLFRKFYRVRRGDTYPAKGFGIGLNFVKKILDAHGGKIKVESVFGRGSVFKLELPQN
jgi:two-component system phosphate regulon sensor histidine kinase PhoR